MERFTRWAIAGSLVWLLMATGLILATHSRAATTERSDQTLQEPSRAIEAPAASWSTTPASMELQISFDEWPQC